MIPHTCLHPLRASAIVLLFSMIGVGRCLAQSAPDEAGSVSAEPAVAGVAATETIGDSESTTAPVVDTSKAIAGVESGGAEGIESLDTTDPPRLTQAEYFDGGNPRYTLHGK